jgi:hypothetical protein
MFVIAGGLVVWALMSGAFQPNNDGRSQSVNVRVPVIRTPLVSATDGRVYNVQTQFYVRMDRETRRSVGPELLEEALSEIMMHMDYDTLAGLKGIDYINDRATEELNRYLADHIDTRVVVTGISTDDRIQLQDEPNNRRDDLFRGIFPNVN